MGHKKLPIADEQLNTLLHALGIQLRNGKWSRGGWRNYYSISKQCPEYVLLRELMLDGWMRVACFNCNDGIADWVFEVSRAGIAALVLAGWDVDCEKAREVDEQHR